MLLDRGRLAPGFSFQQTGTCTTPFPNTCSAPTKNYWEILASKALETLPLVEICAPTDLHRDESGVVRPRSGCSSRSCSQEAP